MQAALDAKRRAAATLGLVIRPRQIKKANPAGCNVPASKPVADGTAESTSPNAIPGSCICLRSMGKPASYNFIRLGSVLHVRGTSDL